MQQITIKSISIEGFRSYSEPTSFKFENTGLYLIKGPNGEGKSTLFTALVWGLFKTTPNNTPQGKLPTWEWLRHKGYKGTRVQVLFGVGKYKYLVARHIDYKGTTKGITAVDSLLIFRKEKVDKSPICDADIVNDPLYKSDAQAYLNRLLGTDARTFCNSVLFGQRMARLMDSKDADKRELFERLFDASFIDVLKDKADAKLKDNASILQQLTQDHAVALSQLEQLEQQYENASTILDEFNNSRKVTLLALKQQHASLKAEIAEVEEAIAKEKRSKKPTIESPVNELAAVMDAAREVYYEAKDEKSMAFRDMDGKSRDIGVYTDREAELVKQLKEVKTKCPTCGTKLSEVSVIAARNSIQDQITDCTNIIKALKKNYDTLAEAHSLKAHAYNKAHAAFEAANDAYIDAKSKQVPVEDNKLTRLNTKLTELTTRLESVVEAHSAAKNQTAPTVNITQINSQLGSIKSKIPEFEKAIRIKNNYKVRLSWWLKAFGAGGLKAYIFSAMLNRLNECISVYTTYFGISIAFGVDLSKPSKPFYCKVTLDGQHEVDYNELSGGQKQRIDIIIAMSIQDAAEANSIFNISVFDEPESGLDTEALELLDTLLRLRAERKAVYVISHYQLLDLSGATVYDVSGGKQGVSAIN